MFQGRGWQCESQLWNLLSIWRKTCQVVNCLLCFAVSLSAFCLKKMKYHKIKEACSSMLWLCLTLSVLPSFQRVGSFEQVNQKIYRYLHLIFWFGKNIIVSLYSLIWDFHLSQINIWTTTTWSNLWVVLPKPSWYEFLIGFLIWTPLQSICILQHSPIFVWFYPCSYICNCLKMPKKSQINEYNDVCSKCCYRLVNFFPLRKHKHTLRHELGIWHRNEVMNGHNMSM